MLGRIEELIRESSLTDRELEEIARRAEPRIAVLGVGGAGCNAVDALKGILPRSIVRIAVNTDSQKLLKVDADRKILIGESLLGGRSTGRNRELGRKALLESSLDVEEAISGADIVFVIAGMAGGTGGGATPEIARIAWKQRKLVVVMGILPFGAEGANARREAMEAVSETRKYANTVILSENDRLLERVRDLPMEKALVASVEILAMAVHAILEALSRPSLVNVNLSDMVQLLREGGLATMGIGESSGEDRAREAVSQALSSPFFELSPPYKGAMVMAWASETPTVEEVNSMFEAISAFLVDNALIVWGAGSRPELRDRLRVLLLLAGGKYPHL